MDTHPNDPTALRPEDSIRVAEIREALIAELSAERDKKPTAIKDVLELKEDALTSLKHTLMHSQNESLKSRVSMWALDKIIESEKANADDPMTEFLRNLTGTNSEVTQATEGS